MQLNGIHFDWIVKEGIHENKGSDLGIIAQEVEAIFPISEDEFELFSVNSILINTSKVISKC